MGRTYLNDYKKFQNAFRKIIKVITENGLAKRGKTWKIQKKMLPKQV